MLFLNTPRFPMVFCPLAHYVVEHRRAAAITGVRCVAGVRLPDTKLLLMATFPRDAQPDTPFRKEVSHLNRLIQKFRWVSINSDS